MRISRSWHQSGAGPASVPQGRVRPRRAGAICVAHGM